MSAMLTGEPMDAVTAERWGMVNEVVPAAQVLPRAGDRRSRCDERAVGRSAAKAVRRLIRGGHSTGEKLGGCVIDAEVPAVMGSADAAEGPRIFMDKRAPSWRGADTHASVFIARQRVRLPESVTKPRRCRSVRRLFRRSCI